VKGFIGVSHRRQANLISKMRIISSSSVKRGKIPEKEMEHGRNISTLRPLKIYCFSPASSPVVSVQMQPGMLEHACSPKHSGGGGRSIESSRPTWATWQKVV
jgi:hypothetical protein